MSEPGYSSISLFVTPAGYDDIGAILSELGPDYRYRDIQWDALTRRDGLKGCDALYVNGSSWTATPTFVHKAAPVIREFVRAGGSLYASDWAGGILEAAFPEAMAFDRHGGEGEIPCRVRDPYLRKAIGETIELNFPLEGWWRPSWVHGSVFVYVEGDSAPISPGSNDMPPGPHPLVAGFAYGRGRVLFSSFEVAESTSDDEEQLLRYLARAPALAARSAQMPGIPFGGHFEPLRQTAGAIDPKGSDEYLLQAGGGETLVFALHWSGNARLRMTVQDPNGAVVFRKDGAEPPLAYEQPRAARGAWVCTVEAPWVPFKSFPYLVGLVTRTPGSQAPAPPKPGAAQSAPRKRTQSGPKEAMAATAAATYTRPKPKQARRKTAAPSQAPATRQFGAAERSTGAISARQPAKTEDRPRAAGNWPCYVVVDCSVTAADICPSLGPGVARFLKALARREGEDSRVKPSLTVISSREDVGTFGPVSSVRRLRSFGLACRGKPVLNLALVELMRRLQRPPLRAVGRPLALVALVAEPVDSYENSLGSLRQFVREGRVNVVAAGVGRGVPDHVLQSIGNVCVRADSLEEDGPAKLFGWFGQAACHVMDTLAAAQQGASMRLPKLPPGLRWIR